MPARPRTTRNQGSEAPNLRRSSLPPLLPEPRRVALRGGWLALPAQTPIVIAPAAPTPGDPAFDIARLLQRRAHEDAGLTLTIESRSGSQRRARTPSIDLVHGDAIGIPGDASTLIVDQDRVELRAGGAAGLRYAVETLAQLLAGAPKRRDGTRKLRLCTIEDMPDFGLRGVMLDVSRGKVPTLATLRQIVELLARLKLNALMLYVEHTFRFPSHPAIGAGDSPLDGQTLRALDAFAARRHVQLVPSLQSLGHMEQVLRLPEYADLAESPRGWALSPSDERSYELLADLYGDFLPNFRSPFFNANCDEPLDLDTGRSAELARELGPGGVYARHVERVHDLSRAHGKSTMIWGDVVRNHPERIEQLARLDPPLVMLDWWYEAEFDYERAAVFREHGLEFVACPGTSSWNCLFPRIENSLRNISGWAEGARKLGALGVLNTDWGDFGHYNLQGNSWLGFAWGAQESWSGSTEPKRFDTAFSALVFGDPSPALARCYRKLGAVHDPGFEIFNGSALQYAYFDELDEAYFLSQAKPRALARCRSQLEDARRAILDARGGVRREMLAWEELLYAADASLVAVEKCERTLELLAWRKDPTSLGARKRRSLAEALGDLAKRQTALSRRFRKLWLERSAVSNIALTEGRARNSIRSLRAMARALERGAAPPAPPPHEGFAPRTVLARLRASIEAGGQRASGGAI